MFEKEYLESLAQVTACFTEYDGSPECQSCALLDLCRSSVKKSDAAPKTRSNKDPIRLSVEFDTDRVFESVIIPNTDHEKQVCAKCYKKFKGGDKVLFVIPELKGKIADHNATSPFLIYHQGTCGVIR